MKEKVKEIKYTPVCTFGQSQGFMLAFQPLRNVQVNVFVHTAAVMKRGYNIFWQVQMCLKSVAWRAPRLL